LAISRAIKREHRLGQIDPDAGEAIQFTAICAVKRSGWINLW
jgi:hypothetical protein